MINRACRWDKLLRSHDDFLMRCGIISPFVEVHRNGLIVEPAAGERGLTSPDGHITVTLRDYRFSVSDLSTISQVQWFPLWAAPASLNMTWIV